MLDAIKDKLLAAVMPMGVGATETFDPVAVLHVHDVVLPPQSRGRRHGSNKNPVCSLKSRLDLPPLPSPVGSASAVPFRLVCISDTHQRHRTLKTLPDGDVLVHAGDILLCNRLFSEKASLEALMDFNAWLGEQPHSVKIVVAGNHDCTIERLGADRIRALLTNATYLEYDSVSISHPRHPDAAPLRVFGTPFSRGKSKNKAFQERQSKAQPFPEHRLPQHYLFGHASHHDKACDGPLVDVFVSHQHVLPEFSVARGLTVASLHVGGHIHSYYGVRQVETEHGTPYISVIACTLDGKYKVANPPVVVDILPHQVQ